MLMDLSQKSLFAKRIFGLFGSIGLRPPLRPLARAAAREKTLVCEMVSRRHRNVRVFSMLGGDTKDSRETRVRTDEVFTSSVRSPIASARDGASHVE